MTSEKGLTKILHPKHNISALALDGEGYLRLMFGEDAMICLLIIIMTFTREGPAGFHQLRQIAPREGDDLSVDDDVQGKRR
jgi:hypothetical protein